MDKITFLKKIKSTRSEFEERLQGISDAEKLEPGVSGKMSIKDIIAHVSWFEREMVELLEQRALAGSALWNYPPHERNEAIYQVNRDRSLNDVREEAREVFQQFIKAMETLPEEALNDPAAFRNMPSDWIPWKLIADNSSDHYAHHTADIRAWLEKRP